MESAAHHQTVWLPYMPSKRPHTVKDNLTRFGRGVQGVLARPQTKIQDGDGKASKNNECPSTFLMKCFIFIKCFTKNIGYAFSVLILEVSKRCSYWQKSGRRGGGPCSVNGTYFRSPKKGRGQSHGWGGGTLSARFDMFLATFQTRKVWLQVCLYHIGTIWQPWHH